MSGYTGKIIDKVLSPMPYQERQLADDLDTALQVLAEIQATQCASDDEARNCWRDYRLEIKCPGASEIRCLDDWITELLEKYRDE